MMGNHATCKTVGIGTVKIKMHDGIIRTSTNVRHVPGLRLNLISLGALDSIFCNITIADGVIKVNWATMIVMKREKKANLNRFFSASVIGGVVLAFSDDHDAYDVELWHMRLACTSMKGMLELHKKRVFRGMKISRFNLCKYCVFAK